MRLLRLSIIAGLFILIFLGRFALASGIVRDPYAAGSFYPSDPEQLFSQIDSFLQNVPIRKSEKKERIIGLVVPHAGYTYSGQVAAYAYKQIQGQNYDTVFLIGPSHRKLFKGAAVWQEGDWKTPLGTVKIDSEIARSIAQSDPLFQQDAGVHAEEHSLEVQLPFLQRVLKDFKIVPIVTGDLSLETSAVLGSMLADQYKNSKKKMLFVFSTDMSHYRAAVETARMDRETMGFMMRSDSEGLYENLTQKKSELCGAGAVLAMIAMQEHVEGLGLHYLKYSHSGAVTGENDSVVGYGAFALIKNFEKSARVEEPPAYLKISQRQTLLKIARESVEYYLQHKEKKEFLIEDPILKQARAVFVTIRKNEELRGCIGDLLPEAPLYLSVQDNAVLAAVNDSRFKPMTLKDLPQVKFEISVLSLPEKIDSTEKIELSRHGVILQSGEHSGVFLPKVAAETGWSKEKFLGELCSQKAGLPENCWKDSQTKLFTFTAEDFKE